MSRCRRKGKLPWVRGRYEKGRWVGKGGNGREDEQGRGRKGKGAPDREIRERVGH